MDANLNPEQGPNFRFVFGSVLGLTLLCLAVAVYLVLEPQSEAIKSLVEKVISVFTLGCGAIFGLISGRTLR